MLKRATIILVWSVAIAAAVALVWCVAHVLFAPKTEGATFTYSKVLQDSEGGACDDCVVKVYRGPAGTLYGVDTCDATGTFSFTLTDSFSFYRVDVTNWDVNAPWRIGPMTWLYESVRSAEVQIDTTFVEADSIATGAPRIAGLQAGAWKPSAGYMIPRGGMLSIRLDDYGTALYPVIDSAEAHNIRLSLLAVTGLGGTDWTYPGVPAGTKRSDYLRWRRDMAHGHEVLDHSTYHDVASGYGWSRGLAPSAYAAKLDSAQASFTSYMGHSSKAFIWPGGSIQQVYNDTVLSVLRGRYRFGVEHNPYPCPPLSKWRYVGAPGVHNESKSQVAHHPFNMPHTNIEYGTLAANRFRLAQAFVRHGWQVIFGHGPAYANDKMVKLMLWADSLGIPILPITEAAELYYYGDFDTYHNLFLPDPFSYDLDGDGNCDYFTDSGMSDTLYTGAWTTVPDYPDTPCGTKMCALVINNASNTHEGGFYVGGIRAGSYYEGSLWVKSHESVPDLPDTFAVAMAQYDTRGQSKYTPYQTTILSDTSWTQVAPASFTYIPPDTLANTGPPPLGGGPTEYLGFFVFNSSAYNSADKDSFLVACPLIREKEEVGVTP